jgi:site-specific DNA-methyltransferase (adenine-specific)
MNHLYFGDSLEILKQLHSEHPKGFIDLVYIDPPFNSKRNYNVLFETVDLHDAKAQKEAFADTWSNVSYKDTLHQLSEIDLDLYNFLNALDHVRISQSAVSYLTTMAIRIYYINKVLKPTGSFYLHCDDTMSHYLKVVCDLIFGETSFKNEIVWKKKTGRGETNHKSNRFGDSIDVILFYGKSKESTFNAQYNNEAAGYENYLNESFKYVDENGRKFMSDNLSSPSPRPNLKYVYKGYNPPDNGWAISIEKMEQWDKEGRLIFPKTKDGRIRRKRYLDEVKGKPVQNLWDDIDPIGAQAAERLGYPTQKPQALLERIIQASSNEGDVVADFFCGCGTTVAAAQKLNRQWIGVDISHLAIGLIRKRLIDTYGEPIAKTFTIDGLPKDIATARMLAVQPQGRMRFQDWVIETLLGGVTNEKKTGDGGYDGYTTLEVEKGKKEIVLIEVKSGNITVSTLRSFAKTVQQQKGSMGILVCFKEQITKGMLSEAKGEGYFREDLFGNRFDKIQVISVEDLLEGKMPEMPKSYETGPFKKAEKAEKKSKGQKGLFD